MKIESFHNSEDKRRWKIVRTDDYKDVPGEIVAADEATGECAVHFGGETKTLPFGPGGIRLVSRTSRELAATKPISMEEVYSSAMGDCG